MVKGSVEVHALVFGRVQGVGYRWTVVDCAKSLGIKGTVRNLPNGSVEIHAQGNEEALKQFLSKIQSDCAPAVVNSVESQVVSSHGVYEAFNIVR